MEVRKSNNTVEEYNVEKLETSISESFKAANEEVQSAVISTIINNLYVYDNISTSEIRRQVEDCLMSINKKAAKQYISKYDADKDLRKKQDFIRQYIAASNAATGSQFDSNANVTNKNIVTLGQELYKENNIKQNRYIMHNKIRNLYSKKLADQYIADLESHILYKHDESGTPGFPYCVAITMYPFLTDGLTKLGGVSIAPTDTRSYCGEFINLVYSISSQYMGACMHHSQDLLIDGKNQNIRCFVNEFSNWSQFEVNNQTWEFCSVKDNHYISEEKKYVKINKVYRRKYDDDIYKITTKTGNVCSVTKDHIIKVIEKNKIVEKKASDISLFDTVVINNNLSNYVDFNSIEYKRNFCLGMLLGDGGLTTDDCISLAINYNQKYYFDIFNNYSNEVFGNTLNLNEGHNCFGAQKRNKEYKDKICSYLCGSKTIDKNIKAEYLNTVDECVGFLDGIMSADGVYNNAYSICLINKLLIESCIKALSFLNVPYKYREVPEHDNKKRLYCLSISSRAKVYLQNFIKKCKKHTGSNFIYYIGNKAKSYYKTGDDNSVFTSRAGGFKKSMLYELDVVTDITKFKNDDVDGYVYELETETHWYSCGGIITHNCATSEFLMYMDYFLRKDYGNDYIEHLDDVVELSAKKRTLTSVIDNHFQSVVHSMNMPAGNRGYQTVFWNIGYFDKSYFEGVFGDFVFPDGTKPVWETLSWLQKHFMNWFNEERNHYILTFPVETMALLTDGKDDFIDKEYADFTAEMWSKGHSFFTYLSDSPDSLSSCCRLRNSIQKQDDEDEHNHTTHQYSMGTASVATGSKSVMTINIPRLVQNAVARYFLDNVEENGFDIIKGEPFNINVYKKYKTNMLEYIKTDLTKIVERVHKYQTAFNETIKDFLKAGMLDVYSAGFIDMKKQYLTVGVNGMVDAAEYLGIDVKPCDEYKEFTNEILETINVLNKRDKTKEVMFNTEFVPAENLAVKNYKWDKKDGFWVSPKRNLYSSYFYGPEDKSLTVLDKFKLHGREYVDLLDGGSALHLNCDKIYTKDQYRQLLKVAANYGCNYFTFNVKSTVCNDCGHISKHTLDTCPKCGSKNLDYLTRVIGYLKRISSFSEPRQEEAKMRVYHD